MTAKFSFKNDFYIHFCWEKVCVLLMSLHWYDKLIIKHLNHVTNS